MEYAALYLVTTRPRRSGAVIAPALLADCPQLDDGVRGLRFVDAAMRSNAARQWISLGR